MLWWYTSEKYHLEPENKPWESKENILKGQLGYLKSLFWEVFFVECVT